MSSGVKALLITLACCGGLFALMVVVIAAVSPNSKTTTTQGATPTYVTTLPEAPSTTTTTTAPPTTVAHVPTPEDFQLEIIETSRNCFGSAGCNVKFKINPTYTGPAVNSSKSYTIIYEVAGGDDTKTDNFTMRGDKWSGGSEDFISTPPGAVLTAKVVRIA